MAKAEDLAEIFEKIGRLHLKAGRILREVGLDPSLLERDQKKPTIHPDVIRVYDKWLEARHAHYEDKLGRPPKGAAPALTPERAKLVADAIRRHGVERVVRAVLGIWLDPWMTGDNPNGREYTELERAVSPKRKDGVLIDPVDRFADLYAETHREF